MRYHIVRNMHMQTCSRGVRGGNNAYAKQFDRPLSDENYSRQIDEGYARQLSGHDVDDVSPITRLQLRPGHFGGIAQRRRRNEFGRGLSTLLTGDGYLTTNYADDDVEMSNGGARGFSSNNDGYTRHLNQHSDDEDEESGVNLRPGRFGGITGTYQNVFGHGPSTLLTGRYGFLTNSIATNEIETNPRGRGVGSVDAAASQQSNGSGSVLAALRNWSRQRFSRWQAPHNQMEMQRPVWLRDVEPEQH